MSIQLKNISKSFGHAKACENIDLELIPGKVHAIVGDNGVGKSTLMKILAGIVIPDSGSITIDGNTYNSLDPSMAKQLNISMVHQGFSLVERLNVKENIQLGRGKNGSSFLGRLETPRNLSNLSNLFFDLELTALVEDLDMGQRQQLEILKALDPEPKILILDEPTAFLNAAQVTQLQQLIKELTGGGCAVAFISHDLEEVQDISDFISILEDGKVVETAEKANFSYQEHSQRKHLASAVSEMENPILELVDFPKLPHIRVRPSEIVALNGAPQLMDELMNVFLSKSKLDGKILIEGKSLNPHIAGAIAASKISVIPKDKVQFACIPQMTVLENLFLLNPLRNRGAFLLKTAMRKRAKELMEEYNIIPTEPEMLMSELSGGNQQRVLLARELSSDPKLLIIEGLTEGLDASATNEILWSIQRAATRGVGILILSNSSELQALAQVKIEVS